MFIRKHIHSGEHDCGRCGCDHYFNLLCEKDPSLEEKAKELNEKIKKRMLEIEAEQKNQPNSS
jgi:hypothetical protein